MKKYNIFIYDDITDDSEALKSLLYDAAGEYIADIKTAQTISDAKRLLNEHFSVVFLDIELENRNNGIEFADYIKANYPDMRIVFVTAHIKYCEEIYPVKSDGFLVKPIDKGKLCRNLKHIFEMLNENNDDYLIASVSKYNSVRIFLNQISYIETCGRKLFFYDKECRKVFTVTEKLSSVEKRLPDYFTRCHQSFCVNLRYVSDVKRYEVTLGSGNTVPVSQKRYEEAKKSFVQFLGRYI